MPFPPGYGFLEPQRRQSDCWEIMLQGCFFKALSVRNCTWSTLCQLACPKLYFNPSKVGPHKRNMDVL